jgi:hypothetical protein
MTHFKFSILVSLDVPIHFNALALELLEETVEILDAI